MRNKGKQQRRKKTSSVLVRNKDTADSKQIILKFTLNLLPSACRLETLEGQEYTVVPMVILTEGVHSGSMGPLYYPKNELSKTPVVWNHKPVVVYHPTMNGVGVSACDPVIINSRKVGVMMNTRFENGKLKSEAWLLKDRANEVDERIMTAVDSGEMMELSTGVFIDVEEKEGNFGEESYSGIARNFRPDHLALLPDQIGACSIADGAGFLRNAAKGVKDAEKVPLAVLKRAMEKMGLSGNALSHSDIHEVLRGLLRDRFGVGRDEFSIWVMDVFNNFVVYENDGTLFRLGYTSNDDEVQLSEDTPVEVERVSEYRTVQNATESNETIMNAKTKKLVDVICGNAKWSDEDREKLGKLPEEKLNALAEAKKANPKIEFSMAVNADGGPEGNPAPATPTPEPAPAPAPETPPAPATPPAPTTPPAATANQAKTAAEYIAGAPSEIQQVLNEGLSTYNAEKATIVANILANTANSFTEADLNTRPLGELRKMAQLMGSTVAAVTPQYGGQGQVPTDNTEGEEVLTMPAIKFGT